MEALVGRVVEVRRLCAWADRARAGERILVLVDGVAGIGKTSLVEAAISDLQRPSDVVVLGHGVELSEGQVPYGAVSECLRNLVHAVGLETIQELAGTELGILAAVCPPLGTPEPLDRTRLFPAFVTLMEQVAGDRFLCLVIEDMQWVDDYSRDLFGYLIRTATPSQLMVVVTLRNQDPAGTADPPLADFVAELTRVPHTQHVTLRPLATDDVAAQAANLGQPTGRALLRRLVDLSGGVPFLVQQLVLAGLDESGPVPATVWEPMRGRILRLPDQTLRLAQIASLADGYLQHHLLQNVFHGANNQLDADRDREFGAATATAIGQFILVYDETQRLFAFSHSLLREAVDATIVPADRLRWHRAWASELARSGFMAYDPLARVGVAKHWLMADAVVEAFETALEAADECRRYGAIREVATMLQQAMDLWDRVPTAAHRAQRSREDLLTQLCDALWRCGDTEQILRLLDAELRRTDTRRHPLRELCLKVMQADALESGGQNVDAQVWETAVASLPELLRGPPTLLIVDALRGIADHVLVTDPDLSRSILEQVLHHTVELDEPRLQHDVAERMLHHVGYQGRFDDAVALARKLPSVPHPSAVDRCGDEVTLGISLWATGGYTEAIAVNEKALARLPEPELALEVWKLGALSLVDCLIAVGKWDRAQEQLRTMRMYPQTPNNPVTIWTCEKAGVLACQMGDSDGANESLQVMARSVAAPEPATPAHFRVPYRHLEAESALLRGDADGARAVLRSLWGGPGNEQLLDLWFVLLLAARLEADLAVEQGDAGMSNGSALEALLAAAAAVPRHTALADTWWTHLQAELSRAHATADTTQWVACVGRWRNIGHIPWLAYTLTRHGEASLAEGARANAAQSLAEAFTLATEMGAEPLRDLIISIATKGRIRLDGVGTHATPSLLKNRLTQRELEVLRLVAQGMSNGEIATTLYISRKTASVHVSRILAKLDVPTRAKAGALAYREGLFE